MPCVHVRPGDYVIAVKVPRLVKEKIVKIAEERGKTVSELVKELIYEEIERYEQEKNQKITSFL